jgi:hypothetical protein
MTITFENDDDVIVYALEKVISYARRTQQIFVAQCVWWLASIIGLERGLVVYIDNIQSRINVTIIPEKIPSVGRSESPIPRDLAEDQRLDTIPDSDQIRQEIISPTPRDLQEDSRQDTHLKECEEFLRESARLRESITSKAPEVLRHRKISITPRDVQEDQRRNIGIGFVHPDRRNQVQEYDSDISGLELEDNQQKGFVVQTELAIPRTRKQRKEFNKQKQSGLVHQNIAGKITKPVSKRQRKFLSSIPKDTISEYLQNRK